MTIIGVDVGGTKIAAGLVDLPKGEVSERRTLPANPARGSAAVLADVESLVAELAATARAAGREVAAIGLGVCELVDPAGRIVSAQTLDWPGAMVAERLAPYAPRVAVEADVRAAARAEARFGAGRGVSVFLYLSIGTGIASALVIDGRPFPGARGATGTLASGLLPDFHKVAAHTPARTLEELSAGPALVTRFRQFHGVARTGEDVLAAAAAGDARAVYVVTAAAHVLGASIGGLVNVLDPACVILGGGLGLAGGLYRESLIAAARQHIWWPGHRDLSIVAAETGADAGLLGAALAAG